MSFRLLNRTLPVMVILCLAVIHVFHDPAQAATGKKNLTLVVPATWSPKSASAEQRQVIRQLKGRLKNNNSLRITVTGHTDTLGSESENNAIGYYYASRVAEGLKSAFKISGRRIDIYSRGESEPLEARGGFDRQRRNRRVEIGLGKPRLQQVRKSGEKLRGTEGKSVIILEPAPGTVDRSYQVIRAVVGNSPTAMLTINGLSSLVTVQDSRIEAEAVLERGDNSIEVMAWDDSGAFGKDQVIVTYVPPPPQIEVYQPEDGQIINTTHSPVVHVNGKILATTPLKESFLFLNGSARRIDVNDNGEFNQPIVLIRRHNDLRIEALDIYNKTATSPDIKVDTLNLAPEDMVVFLDWDKPGVDLDLHVHGPGGTHTYYAALDPFESREAIPSADLDLDDKDGYGPEVFSMQGGQEGDYWIDARYHHSLKNTKCMATVTVVLHPADPARRITRIFGPHLMGPGELGQWQVTVIKMPEGIFRFKETGQ